MVKAAMITNGAADNIYRAANIMDAAVARLMPLLEVGYGNVLERIAEQLEAVPLVIGNAPVRDLMGEMHELKTDPVVFELSQLGLKLFEIREDDRDFKQGDILQLKETKYSAHGMVFQNRPLEFTGRVQYFEVTCVISGYGLIPGFVALGLKSTTDQTCK